MAAQLGRYVCGNTQRDCLPRSDQLHSTSGDWPVLLQELPDAGTQGSPPKTPAMGHLTWEPLE